MSQAIAAEQRPIVLLQFSELNPKKGIRFSRAHIWRLVRAGKFPKPVPVGEHARAWIEYEIDDHLRQLANARGRAR